jgi:hypothetical protein
MTEKSAFRGYERLRRDRIPLTGHYVDVISTGLKVGFPITRAGDEFVSIAGRSSRAIPARLRSTETLPSSYLHWRSGRKATNEFHLLC